MRILLCLLVNENIDKYCFSYDNFYLMPYILLKPSKMQINRMPTALTCSSLVPTTSECMFKVK